MIFGMGNGQQQRGGGGGLPIRLIIGVIIAIAGVVSYMNKTQVNDVTGEKQRVAWGPAEEMRLGLAAAPQMAQQMGGRVDPATDRDAARVAQVGKRLAYGTEAAKSAYAKQNNFNFYLLNDRQTVNAFALPGGQIFITRALYDKFENEAQLAGVLGHEVGHVIHKHGAEHMASGQLGQMLVTAVAVGASDQGGGNMAAMAASMANNMAQLKYGRGDELESDAYGMRLMSEIGYDPAEMLGVMRILAEAGGKGGRGSEMLMTHPHPESRIEQIKQILAKYKDEFAGKNLTKGPSLR